MCAKGVSMCWLIVRLFVDDAWDVVPLATMSKKHRSPTKSILITTCTYDNIPRAAMSKPVA